MESLTSRDRSSLGDLEKIEALIQLKVDVEKQREICKARRWKIGRVVLRDVLGKILIWVEKLIKIGDMVVQYDPGHAALPWACMRLILQVKYANRMCGLKLIILDCCKRTSDARIRG